MDRLQVIAALQKWIQARRREVAFIEKHREVLDERRAQEFAVKGARSNLAKAMTSAMAGRPDKEKDTPYRITIPDDGIVIEMKQGDSDFTCSRADIVFPAKSAT